MLTTRKEKPIWLDLKDPLGSAVRHLADSFSLFDWVGIYVLSGDQLKLNSYIGAPTEHTQIPVGKGICGRAIAENRDLNIPNVHLEDNYLACSLETQSELVVLIRDSKGNILGQIDIDSHTRDSFGPHEEAAVREVASVIGDYWPRL